MHVMKQKRGDADAPEHEKKDSVLCFRVPERIAVGLKARAANASIEDACSANQYARKIVLAFLAGHLERLE